MPGLVLRPYQQLAIDSFERDRAAGRTSTHIVSPPGSGKTVVGLEIVRRLGRPALVLAPTATIQAQWADKHPDSAKEIFKWDGEHPDRTKAFVDWAIKSKNDDAIAFHTKHNDWPEYQTLLDKHRFALDDLAAWARKFPDDAKALPPPGGDALTSVLPPEESKG